MEINPKIKEILSSGSFEDYEKESLECLEKWQYLQRADISNENRFTEDVEAYKERYFNTAHLHNAPYNELALIKMLIKNIENAKHPVLENYRDFLESKLKGELPDNAEPMELPDNLRELLSIWHDKKDIKNLVCIYRQHESIFTKPTKKLMSCFAYELYEKKWLTTFEEKTFNPTEIAKIFLKLANLKFYPSYKNDFMLTTEKPDFNLRDYIRIKIDMRK